MKPGWLKYLLVITPLFLFGPNGGGHAAPSHSVSPIQFSVFHLKQSTDPKGGVDIDYSLAWPVSGAPAPVLKTIRRKVVALFLSGAEIRAPKEAVTDPQRLLARAAEAFAAPFKAFRKDFPDSAPGWEDNRKLSVTFQRSGILTLTLDQFYFSGGAHPNGGLLHRVLDTRSGDDLVGMSIFKRGVESRLTTLIKREIRKKWKLPAGASLDKQGFWENQIKPENVYVSSSGVGFTYNAYDIAPYVMGPTDIVIPYPALSSLLNPNSPVKELAR